MRTTCLCGCGQKTPLATRFDKRHGYKEGEPKKYIRGHNDSWGNEKGRVKVVGGGAVEIPLTKGYVAWVDSNSPARDRIRSLHWSAIVRGDRVYAATYIDDEVVFLHRMVVEADLGVKIKRVGFINNEVEGGSVIDCRRDNLEVKKL